MTDTYKDHLDKVIANADRALAKDGFEGIQLIALADGAAVALKISDGGDRARMPAAVPALLALGVDAPPLEPFNNLPALGGGQQVGALYGLPLP